MATVTSTSTRTRPEVGEHRFVIYNIGWEGYQGLLRIVGDMGPA